MRKLRLFVGCLTALALFGTSPVLAATGMGTSPLPDNISVEFPMAPLSITQSATLNIVSGNSVSCNNGFGHTNNSYWRRFDLNGAHGIIAPFNVTSVDVGVEFADAGGADQPVTVRLYTIPNASALSTVNITLIGSATVNIPDQQLTMINVPVAGLVATPLLQDLVVEVFTPNGHAAANFFWIGSNSDGQTAPSYISAGDCGIPQPTDLAAIGFGNMMIVMVVNGNETPTPTATRTLGAMRAMYR